MYYVRAALSGDDSMAIVRGRGGGGRAKKMTRKKQTHPTLRTYHVFCLICLNLLYIHSIHTSKYMASLSFEGVFHRPTAVPASSASSLKTLPEVGALGHVDLHEPRGAVISGRPHQLVVLGDRHQREALPNEVPRVALGVLDLIIQMMIMMFMMIMINYDFDDYMMHGKGREGKGRGGAFVGRALVRRHEKYTCDLTRIVDTYAPRGMYVVHQTYV